MTHERAGLVEGDFGLVVQAEGEVGAGEGEPGEVVGAGSTHGDGGALDGTRGDAGTQLTREARVHGPLEHDGGHFAEGVGVVGREGLDQLGFLAGATDGGGKIAAVRDTAGQAGEVVEP